MGISTVKMVHRGCRDFTRNIKYLYNTACSLTGLANTSQRGTGDEVGTGGVQEGVSGGTCAGEEGGDSVRAVKNPGRKLLG